MKLEGFDIKEQLGRGGMATVYRARQISLDREVAVKVFEPGFEPTAEDRNQFQIEARVAARLKHPGLVQIYDAIFTNETYCFVMELVNGYTVGAWNDRKGHLEERQVLDIADYVAAALDYAWTQHGIIHCDIKPENLMVDADGTVKVLDLGLCKTAQAMLQLSGTSEQVYGTPQYLSPEQAIGQSDLDCRTDIYALGATMYHLATGQMLFPGTDGAETMDKQVRAKTANPGKLNPALSPSFCALVEKMLSKDRGYRQADWKAVRSDIEAARIGHPLASGNPVAGASTVESGPAPVSPAEKGQGRAKVAATRVKIAPAKRKRALVPPKREIVSEGGGSYVSPPTVAVPPAQSHSSAGVWIVVASLVGVVAIAGVWKVSENAKAEKAAQRQAALAEAQQVAALVDVAQPDPESFEQAIAAYVRVGEKFVELKPQVEGAIEDLKNKRKAAEERQQKAHFESVRAEVERLLEQYDFEKAAALFRDDAIVASPAFAAERRKVMETIQEARRKKAEDDRLAEEEARRQREQSQAAERLAEQTTTILTRLLEAFEQNGVGFAASLLAEFETRHPDVFEKSAECSYLRTLFRGIQEAQQRFDGAFKLGTAMTVDLRNGASFRGRLQKVDRSTGELHFQTSVNGIDFNKTVLFRELAPKEILVRLGAGQDPGTRFVRVRLFRRLDLPLPSPTYLEDQCQGFPNVIRKAALQ